MKISPARTAAFDVLSRIDADRAFSSVLLPQYEEKLDTHDAGLCHELVLGVLRNRLYLDRISDVLTGGKRLDRGVRIALEIGLYQLRFLTRIPSHAAVNESVELVVRTRLSSARSLVNAVLRKAARGWPELSFEDAIDRVSVGTSHPRWLVEKWIADHDADTAAEIAAANNRRPAMAFRIINDPIKPSTEWKRSDIVSDAYTVDAMSAELRGLAKQGEIYFQDEASQLVAKAVSIEGAKTFLDVCASPGGKTGLIVSRNSVQHAVAGDLHPHRVRLLKENLLRQRANSVLVVQYDAVKGLPFPDESFDAILVDAPCSGTGTIRHNPEIRYFLEPQDFSDLSCKQQQILACASKALKPGGSLTYSTCSLEREEGEEAIEKFLAGHSDMTLVRPGVPERFLTEQGFARTWPHRDDVDGFFIASLMKRGN